MNAITPSVPGPADASSPAWFEIPRLAARLLWKHWPQLLFWFFAQRAAYNLCMMLAMALTTESPLLGYIGIALLVLVQLATTVMMFLAVKPSLPAISGVLAPDWLPPMQPWSRSLGAVLLPFFAFYVTWGLLDSVKRDFALGYYATDLANAINDAVSGHGGSGDRESWLDISSLRGLWIALLTAAVVRYIAKRRAARTGGLGWTLLATLCEAYWVFVGVTGVAYFIAKYKPHWQEMRFWHAISDWWQNPFVFHLPLDGLKQALLPAWHVLTTVAGAALVPLVWLAITAIIYGLDLRKRQRIDAADSHLAALADTYQGSHFLVKNVADKISAGWNSKGVPVLNSLRLVLRAGLPALLTLCIGWQLLTFMDAWGWNVAAAMIGPMDMDKWEAVRDPVEMLIGSTSASKPSLFTQVLRVVLLAATFDRAVAQLRPTQSA